MPEPARMQVAKGLQSLRDSNKLTQEEVSERSGYGTSTVSRYEEPFSTHKIVPRTVRLLAKASGADEHEVNALVRLAEGGEPQWWGDCDVASSMHPLLSLEATADTECVMAPWLVPGLLQTTAYARAVHQAEQPRKTDESIDRHVAARVTRQGVLKRRRGMDPLHLWAILHETTLRSLVGSREVMAEQIDHLIEASQRPNIDLQIITFDSGASAAGVGHFVTLEAGTSSAVYVELLGGGLYVSEQSQVEGYRMSYDYLRSQAQSPGKSVEILKTARKEYT